jgi:hypothetical protein
MKGTTGEIYDMKRSTVLVCNIKGATGEIYDMKRSTGLVCNIKRGTGEIYDIKRSTGLVCNMKGATGHVVITDYRIENNMILGTSTNVIVISKLHGSRITAKVFLIFKHLRS